MAKNTPNETTDNARPTQRERLLEIVHVIREHDMLSNFIRQKNPEEIRLGFEELGPTFIKIGQILSTRPDLVSPAYTHEFSKLQDNVQIDPYSTVEQTFKEQTGQEIDDVFAEFDKDPFASASIGQTHRALLKDGTTAVVKIQHPKVQELVKTDMSLFEKAVNISKIGPEIGAVDPEEIFNEIKEALFTEINTEIEIKNGQEFYNLNNNDGVITVPRTYSEVSAQKILVTGYMPGESIKYYMQKPLSKNQQQAKQQKQERKDVAQALVRNFVKQIFVDNFFHADPHPGNILFHRLDPKDVKEQNKVAQFQRKTRGKKTTLTAEDDLPNYRITYLDFGMMGRLTPNLVDGIIQIVLALNTKDTRTIGKAILPICNRTGKVDQEKFFEELALFLQPYMQMGLGQVDVASLLFDTIGLCRDNNLQAKSEVTLLVKSFASLEGIVAELDPDMEMMDVARPFAKEYLINHFNWKKQLEDSSLDLMQSVHSLPKIPLKLEQLINLFTNGQTKLNISLKGQEALFVNFGKIVDRLVSAIILAALILGSSLLVQGSAQHPAIYKLGVVGYIISFIVIVLMVLDSLWIRFKHKNK
ncbi:AarF/ABC1/UbiB kinase family protein [Ligilactobacillus pobuzihii]|uniref:AarF/UbiB family protein n=1 Tax=Ligilactobacillus pobuzihii TaxID=449659 RepID=UPI0019CFAC36|nr:AarF/UbiB family protein [Ligilactobacillus pobuzihii]MBN7273969.1 AarF/ABC1/UbiB kinase family protein [Ligilactobacillus pobuzihii]